MFQKMRIGNLKNVLVILVFAKINMTKISLLLDSMMGLCNFIIIRLLFKDIY